MDRIIVTGAGGNVGQYVAQKLSDRGYHVVGIVRNSRPVKYTYEIIKADLSVDDIDMEGIDTIIHIAAGLSGSTEKLVRDNIRSTMKLIRKAEQNNVRRFIYISTVSVYGSVNGELSEDSDIINPEIYGMTKYIAENLVKESVIPEKLVIELPRMLGPFVNLENTSGSGFLTMTKKILNNEDVTCFIPYVQYNNYMHVSDLEDFLETLLNSEKWNTYDKVLLGTKDRLTMLEILQIMKDAVQSTSIITAEDKGISAKCSLISISKAVLMGYKPKDAKSVLQKFIKEVQGE
jgi:nucleoside-diphosphate-sugar epimerase